MTISFLLAKYKVSSLHWLKHPKMTVRVRSRKEERVLEDQFCRLGSMESTRRRGVGSGNKVSNYRHILRKTPASSPPFSRRNPSVASVDHPSQQTEPNYPTKTAYFAYYIYFNCMDTKISFRGPA